MSTEAVAKFLDEVAQNKQLGDEVRGVIAEREEQAAFELVNFAGKRGYEFTATELRQRLVGLQEKTVELSDAELEAVAGGLLTNLGRISIRTLLGRRDDPTSLRAAKKRRKKTDK
jgi:predicted ribosomally synthesized peptide with nif11-like leader